VLISNHYTVTCAIEQPYSSCTMQLCDT